MRLLEIGCFDGTKPTPLLSVRSADTREALRILSLKNAGL